MSNRPTNFYKHNNSGFQLQSLDVHENNCHNKVEFWATTRSYYLKIKYLVLKLGQKNIKFGLQINKM